MDLLLPIERRSPRPLLAALAAELPGSIHREPATEAAGLHLLVGVAGPWSEAELIRLAATGGVHLDPGGACYAATPPPWPSLLLGYAVLPEDEIWAGVRALAAAPRSGGPPASGILATGDASLVKEW